MLAPAAAVAQSAPAGAPATTPQQAPTPPAPPAISGIVVGSYQYLLGGPREDFNQFSVDRAYLTVRGRPAPRVSFRLTSDIYQSGDDNGWTLRMKYAYLDYALRESGDWATLVRAGILQTVAIEQQEQFWPRWLGPVAIDRHGFFQSADAGVAAQASLPGDLGEVYAHVVNGVGYTRREADRFKDFGVRASLTPFASRHDGLLGSATFTGWLYDGAAAGATLGTAGSERRLSRDRWGVHAGVKTHRLTMAVDHSRRTDDRESDPATLPVVVTQAEGAVTSGFAIVRPLAFARRGRTSPFGVFARYDAVERSTAADDDYHYLVAGALYDLNNRFSVALHYQEQLGPAAPSPFRGVVTNFALNY